MKLKNVFGRFAKKIFAEDFNTVKRHVFEDVIIPKTGEFMKQMFLFAVNEAASNMVHGINGGSSMNKSNIITIGNSANGTGKDGSLRKRIDFGNIICVPDRALNGAVIRTAQDKAQYIISALESRIKIEGYATVLDLYSILDAPGMVPSDAEMGWRSLSGWDFIVNPDGTVRVRLPRPKYL